MKLMNEEISKWIIILENGMWSVLREKKENFLSFVIFDCFYDGIIGDILGKFFLINIF